jgi:membrane-bound lytic murein transglycosylase D
VRVYIPRDSYELFAKKWSKQHEPVYVSYVTRFGESLEEIARKVGTSPAKLREINDLRSDARVTPGFPLLVPGAAPSAGARAKEEAPLVATVPAKEFRYEGRRRVFYRVATQDTPASIARFFDISVDELCAWNSLDERAALQKDMLLQLFVAPELDLSRAVVFTPDQVRILTVGSDAFFDFHESQRGRARVLYRVQPNETLEKIGKRFELSAGSIGRINQFAGNKELKADEWILVYVPEKLLPELTKKGLIKPMLELAEQERTAFAQRAKEGAEPHAESASEEIEGAGLPPEAPEGEELEVP